jgi:1,4-dihydroxy-2-naphthoyl-CoA synthase
MNENTAALFAGNRTTLSDYAAEHFGWSVTSGVGTITLNRPERKNPLTFESYAELRDLFRQLAYATDVHVIVIYGAGGNFCSGGDVHDIIAPLVDLPMPELLMFTRMTGDLVKAMRHCPQPVRRRRRDHGNGIGHEARHRAQQARVSVYTRRPCGLRHGCMRHPAAHHRPGTGI